VKGGWVACGRRGWAEMRHPQPSARASSVSPGRGHATLGAGGGCGRGRHDAVLVGLLGVWMSLRARNGICPGEVSCAPSRPTLPGQPPSSTAEAVSPELCRGPVDALATGLTHMAKLPRSSRALRAPSTAVGALVPRQCPRRSVRDVSDNNFGWHRVTDHFSRGTVPARTSCRGEEPESKAAVERRRHGKRGSMRALAVQDSTYRIGAGRDLDGGSSTSFPRRRMATMRDTTSAEVAWAQESGRREPSLRPSSPAA
jgi:hypothetical protein